MIELGGSPGEDRGVSEVIAFVLVFGIVITSVGLLYTVGFSAITDIQSGEQDRSADQAFQAVAVAFDDVQRDRGENRQVSLDLSGRSLSVDDEHRITVSIDGAVEHDATGALVYGGGSDAAIAYHSGAVLRADSDQNQIVRRGPRFRCEDTDDDGNFDRAVVSLVELESDEGGIGSDGSVTVLAEQKRVRESRLVGHYQGVDLAVEYEGDTYELAWERYLEDQGLDSCDSVDDVYVRKTVIEISYFM